METIDNLAKKPLIIIAGPTATGKSAVAMHVAELLGGEIVSADSMQVYKRMDIGTAKPSESDLARVPHHLIDVVEPDYEFSVAVFHNMAKKAISEIHSRGKVPILTGGTGFYINALLYNNEFEQYEEAKSSYKDELNRETPEFLFAKLLEVDPEYATTTHMNNVKRVVRALEYYYETGEKFSAYNMRSKQNKDSEYDFRFFILNRERELLYEGINSRVDDMTRRGLIDEVASLLESGYNETMTSMQGLGYKEICAYLRGSVSKDMAIDMVKQGTRRFAKRQVTWFKHQADGEWLDVDGQSVEVLAKEIVMQPGRAANEPTIR